MPHELGLLHTPDIEFEAQLAVQSENQRKITWLVETEVTGVRKVLVWTMAG